MSVSTELIAGATILVLLLYVLNKLKKTKTFYDYYPRAPGLPLLGNALDFRNTTDILTNLERYRRDHGGILHGKIGQFRRLIVVSDPKFLECIMTSNKLITKSQEYDFLKPWLGTGLLTSTGHKWKSHRRILTPAFHFQILEQFIEIFESCGGKLVDKLGKDVGKKSVDIYELVALCTLDIICESTMGVSINAQDNEESEYVQSVKTYTKIVSERSTSPIQMYDLLFPLTKNYYKQKRALKVLHELSNSVIRKRRERKVNSDNKKRKAFLDTLLDATIDGRPLTQEEIREEVDTFMFEGHDTTATAISFCLYCLANHPEVQLKAFEEQQQIFNDKPNSRVTYTDLQNMRYLDQVIKETLRLYPSVPIILRETNEDFQYNGINLPKGDALLIFVYGLQRSSVYFQPEVFNPDRFEETDGKLPFAYLPFSAGPRNCIGQKFAMLEMKSTISKVLRKYQLKPATPEHVLKLAADTVLKSVNGVRISFELRQ